MIFTQCEYLLCSHSVFQLHTVCLFKSKSSFAPTFYHMGNWDSEQHRKSTVRGPHELLARGQDPPPHLASPCAPCFLARHVGPVFQGSRCCLDLLWGLEKKQIVACPGHSRCSVNIRCLYEQMNSKQSDQLAYIST